MTSEGAQAAGGTELAAPVTAAGQESQSPAAAGGDLRLVHRRLRHQRLARGQSAAGRVGLKQKVKVQRKEGEHFTADCLCSLQPRLAQSGKVALQHRWIFDGHSLFVYRQRELRIQP